MHISLENFYYLTELEEEPLVVSSFLTRILKEMSEPLCTFELYHSFRSINGKHWERDNFIDKNIQ